MNINSIVFLFTFLPITLLLYYIVPKRWKNALLLMASLFFYAWGEPVYLFLLLILILFHYIIGRNIAGKQIFVFSVVADLMFLCFFRYAGSLISSLNTVLSVKIPWQGPKVPLGISFYMLQMLSYIIDVYKGNVKAQKNLVDFALYIAMFPKLTAGPIVRYPEAERQLKERNITWDQFGSGVMLFIRGLAKKLILADTIGLIFTEVTELPAGQVSVLSAWLGCAAYTFQIYFDFSGYSDMAIGLGKMFGFEFGRNFHYPYISRSISEFWRRWHISLSRWFREYVYLPLGTNRITGGKRILNLLLVWFLIGLWHGTSWNYVIWGVYYGILLMFEKYLLRGVLEKLPKIVQHIYCMLLVMIGWLFFAGDGIHESLSYLKVMFGVGAHGVVDQESLYLLTNSLLLWILVLLGSTPIVHRCYEKCLGGNHKKRVWINCLVYAAIFVLCMAYLVSGTGSPFLCQYF